LKGRAEKGEVREIIKKRNDSYGIKCKRTNRVKEKIKQIVGVES